MPMTKIKRIERARTTIDDTLHAYSLAVPVLIFENRGFNSVKQAPAPPQYSLTFKIQ